MTTRARRKEARPREILEAAFAEFVQRGFAATRLEDVAARAGVTKGTIYVYFENKEAVFDGMVRELSKPAFAAIGLPAGAPLLPAVACLRAQMARFFDLMTSDPHLKEILRLMVAESGRFPDLLQEHFEEFIRPGLVRIESILEAGIASGELRPVSRDGMAQLVLSPVLAYGILSLLFANRATPEPAIYFETYVDLVMNGLIVRP